MGTVQVAPLVEKLRVELNRGITTEVQVVYLLASARKILEQTASRDFVALKFHCDWVLHSKLDRAQARDTVKRLKVAHKHFVEGREVHEMPRHVQRELREISQLTEFRRELADFLTEHDIPATICTSDSWTRFMLLYCQIIESVPLELVGDKELTRVVVFVQKASEQPAPGMVLYGVNWRFHDASGKSGVFYVINSFQEAEL